MDIYKWYKISRNLYLHKVPVIPMVIKAAIRIFWGAVIPYQANIGEGTLIGYQGIGVVIHKECIIGRNCHISQNVTFGGGGGPEGVPKIGNNCFFGAGAVILGGINIGNNVQVGANAVVLTDLPDNSVAVGAPARVVKIRENGESRH